MISVLYTSKQLINCGCGDAVIVCVPRTVGASGRPFIEGTLTFIEKVCGSEGVSYNYALTYDETQVVNRGYLNQCDILKVRCKGCSTTYVEYLISQIQSRWWPGSTFFGDGSAGSLTVLNGEDKQAGAYDTSYFYENITVDAGGILAAVTEGRTDYILPVPLWVSDTLTINGHLHCDGYPGVNAVGSVETVFSVPEYGDLRGLGGVRDIGGTGGQGRTAVQMYENGVCSGLGVECGTGQMLGGIGGNGGAGGGGGGEGGTPDDYNSPFVNGLCYYPYKESRLLQQQWDYSICANYMSTPNGGGCGGGGGGGGNRISGSGGAGGTGGGGGGSLYIFARRILIGATGRISANGGKGGNGAAGVTNASGGGGGGGGGGGYIYLVYEELVNEGTIEALGGAIGTGGAGAGAGGVAGSNGLPGNVGKIYKMHLPTGIFQ